MKPRITVLTIGVDDLEASVRFYRDGLGLPTEGITGTEFEYGAVAFFQLEGDLQLALWPRRSISHDTGIPEGPRGPTEFTIGHNVGSRAKVDAVMKQAGDAGARIVKRAGDTFWGGYAGYFQDPDAHLWEVAWNPAIEVND
ncbi:MAG: VOC family protein [Actinomycetota bacterium]|nr:VOC family protein [Actinomycetota bacterium]